MDKQGERLTVNVADISVAVGKRLAIRRRELGLSLAQVSAGCGVSLQQVHKYETGQSSLSVPMMLKLTRLLEVSTTELLAGLVD